MAFSVKLMLMLLCLGSLVLAITGVTAGLNAPFPGTGIALTVATAVPPILQTLDWLWPRAPIGRYREAFKSMNTTIVRLVRRRALRTVLASYGRQEMADRILSPEEAAGFTVKHELRRNRRNRRMSVVAVLAIVVLGVSTATLHNPKNRYARLGQKVSIDATFDVTVLDRPQCKAGLWDYQPSKYGCEVGLRFRNKSQFSQVIGPGSFARVDKSTSHYSDAYAVSLAGSGKHYDYVWATFPTTTAYPEQSIDTTFAFDVPQGVSIDELLLTAPASSTVNHVSLNRQ